MKKFLTTILSILLVVIMSTSLIACNREDNNGKYKNKHKSSVEEPKDPEGPAEYAADKDYIEAIGGVSETFTGAVSTEEYTTAKEAAEGFVANEVVGMATAEVEDVKSVQTYTTSNVDVTIPSELLEGAESIEKMEVTYSVEADEDIGLMSESITAGKQRVVVYVIKFKTNYRYFVPVPVTGETISKSYYDTVFNSNRYENATLTAVTESTTEIKGTGEVDGELMTAVYRIGTKLEQTIKYADNKVFLYQKTTFTQYAAEGDQVFTDESTVNEISAYFEQTEDGIICYVKLDADGSWLEGDIRTIGFSSLEELRPFYKEYLDYTYFLKTDYGFALDQDSIQKYIVAAFRFLLEDAGVNIPDDGVTMTSKYYVQEGALTGAQVNLDLATSMTDPEFGFTTSIKITAQGTTTCSNYGSTEVTAPTVE